MIKEWLARWEDGWLVDPSGTPRPPVHLETPEYRVTHELVDRWGRDLDLPSRLPRIGPWPFWWSLRFELQRNLARALPQLRLLSRIREEMQDLPGRIVLQDPPDSWWSTLFSMEFPGSVLEVTGGGARTGLAGRVAEGRVLFQRAWASSRRFRMLSSRSSGRPRVAVVSHDRMWNGSEDVQLGSVLAALSGAGLEAVVFARPWGSPEHRKRSLETRPPDHLFVDEILFRHVLRRGYPAVPALDLPAAGFEAEGKDLRPLAARFLDGFSRHLYRQRVAYSRTFPDFLRALDIRAGVVTDENAGNHGLKMGFAAAGVPSVAIQHGVIHPDHLSYIYPRGTDPRSVPLCNVTCVRGSRVRRLLLEESCYPEDEVAVTGAVERDGEKIDMEEVARAARDLRRRTLPSGTRRLLFFTSQTQFRQSVAPKLLDAFARSREDLFLVIRPHPMEGTSDFWPRAVADRSLGPRVLLTSEGTIQEWLAACDVHLSVSSTVLSEAAEMDRPSITVGAKAVGDTCGCLEAGVAVELEDFSSLDAAVDHWLGAAPPDADRHRADRSRYAREQFDRPDGRAGERVVEIVSRLVGTGS